MTIPKPNSEHHASALCLSAGEDPSELSKTKYTPPTITILSEASIETGQASNQPETQAGIWGS